MRNKARVLSVLTLLAAGCTANGGRTASTAVESSVSSESVSLQTSPWGREVGALQCRAAAPGEIEQGVRLKTIVELRVSPDAPNGSALRINTFLHAAFLKLHMRSVATAEAFPVEPYDPTMGMHAEDRGEFVESLNGSGLVRWEVSFPLLVVRDSLEPGRYECTVEYAFPDEPTRRWRTGKDAWESAGFWSGAVSSGVFEISVLEETPKTVTLLLPERLRYSAAERKVYYTRDDAAAIEVPVRNGCFMCTEIVKSRGGGGLHGGAPKPDDINGIDNCVDLAEGVELSYEIEIFETPDPPMHLMFPGHRKVLWKKTLTVTRD